MSGSTIDSRNASTSTAPSMRWRTATTREGGACGSSRVMPARRLPRRGPCRPRALRRAVDVHPGLLARRERGRDPHVLEGGLVAIGAGELGVGDLELHAGDAARVFAVERDVGVVGH